MNSFTAKRAECAWPSVYHVTGVAQGTSCPASACAGPHSPARQTESVMLNEKVPCYHLNAPRDGRGPSLSHPRHPTPWYMCRTGLFSAQSFGPAHYERKTLVSAQGPGPSCRWRNIHSAELLLQSIKMTLGQKLCGRSRGEVHKPRTSATKASPKRYQPQPLFHTHTHVLNKSTEDYSCT
jgi:hypothetical protein